MPTLFEQFPLPQEIQNLIFADWANPNVLKNEIMEKFGLSPYHLRQLTKHLPPKVFIPSTKWPIEDINSFLEQNSAIRLQSHIKNVRTKAVFVCSACGNVWTSSVATVTNSIKRTHIRGCRICMNDYSANHNALDSLTPLSSYVLGIIASRGKCFNNNRISRISVFLQDIYLAELLKNFFNVEFVRTKERPDKPSGLYLQVNGVRLAYQVNKILGSGGKIRLNHIPDVIVESGMSNHFIRGLVDSKFQLYDRHLFLIAKIPLLKQIIQMFKKETGLDRGYVRKKKGIGELALNGANSIITFFTWLSQGAPSIHPKMAEGLVRLKESQIYKSKIRYSDERWNQCSIEYKTLLDDWHTVCKEPKKFTEEEVVELGISKGNTRGIHRLRLPQDKLNKLHDMIARHKENILKRGVIRNTLKDNLRLWSKEFNIRPSKLKGLLYRNALKITEREKKESCGIT